MKIKSNFGVNFVVENNLEDYRVDNLKDKEPETIKWIDDFQMGSTFVDIGANIGQYSLYASVHRDCKVYSFEPFYKNYNKLIENIKVNNCENKISPILCALSSGQTMSNFFIKDERSSSSGHQIGKNIDEQGNIFESVFNYSIMTFELDFFIKTFSLESPNYIKIDVDGNENEIINGMSNVLNDTNLKSILIEVNTSQNKSSEIVNKIINCGFTTENNYNNLLTHSRIRRSKNSNNIAENIIFTKINK